MPKLGNFQIMENQPPEKEGFSNVEHGCRFARELLHWHRYNNHRPLAWKGEKDPYKIWLSEVILQQTRVEQGGPYYQRFVTAFPTVQDLAAAPDEAVFKLWEGLGYYSRCRNLLQTARYVARELNGTFPQSYPGLLALKGVGSYTAAAIASFAYNLPCAVVDGNVLRVLTRIFDNDLPVDSTAGKKYFAGRAQALLPVQDAGEYNQALMDFGATVCRPLPLCHACFFSHGCLAYRHGTQLLLPVKAKKAVLKKRWLNYFIVRCGNSVLLQQRTQKDIWHSLHQFFLIETEKAGKSNELQKRFQQQSGLQNFMLLQQWQEKQTLSHLRLCFHFFEVEVKQMQAVEGYAWTSLAQSRQLAFPKTLQVAAQRLSA